MDNFSYHFKKGDRIGIIGKNGVEQIIDINLNEAEKAAFAKSAEAVRGMNADLKTVLA